MATIATTKIPGGIAVPILLESLRFMVDGKWSPAVDVANGTIMLDVPEATNKAFEFKVDPAKRYQEETIVAIPNGSVTYYHASAGGATLVGVQPNLLRNPNSGQFNGFNLYELPAETPPPVPTP